MTTSITAYNFNELTKQTQDEIIDNDLHDLFLEIFHFPNVYDYPDYICNELHYLFEEFDNDSDSFVDEAKQNKKIFHYFRNIIVYNIKDCFFAPKLQKTKNNTHQRVFLID